MSYDDPRTWGSNPERLQWEVYPVDRKGKQCGSSVYVAAANHERALACGKYWRRMLSLKPAKNIEARRYHPERDPYMVGRGFVKLTHNAELCGANFKIERADYTCIPHDDSADAVSLLKEIINIIRDE